MLLIYAILAGDNRTVDALLKLAPNLFGTIEDYMWVKLSLVTTAPSSSGSSSGERAFLSNLSGSLGPGSGGGVAPGEPDLSTAP